MMRDFKVGDIVIRSTPPEGEVSWLRGLALGQTGTITAICPVCGWPYINDWLHTPESLTLVGNSENDELPPVPDSVVYFNSEVYGDNKNNQKLMVGVGKDFIQGGDSGHLYIGVKCRSDYSLESFKHCRNGIGINIDPDSALQLAHDLTRMAMELKRKQEKD